MDWNVDELLNRLQAHGECQRIEAKASKARLGSSGLETISAFANEPGLNGGYLILGLQPNLSRDGQERYQIQGVDDPDRLQQELVGLCRGAFNAQITPEIVLQQMNGRVVVIAYIPEAPARIKPVYIRAKGLDKGSFRRIGSADYLCTRSDLDLLFQLRDGIPYEQQMPADVSWEDIDLEIVSTYRRQRAQVDANASELSLSDLDLLTALKCVKKTDGIARPNFAGLLLFGTKASLRRVLPMSSRVDYIVTEGSEWVGDPSTRYHSIDYRESLITLLPRLHAQVMGDLPTQFSLDSHQVQRTDVPSIPRAVVREALANALMHRDYRDNQPTQIIRYSNRLEFRNAGYSLKPFEELGQPGSKPRNAIVSTIFHELRYAETKGTGIRAMKELMRASGLTTPPIIETDRDRNEFDLVLLPHHLLDRKALEWLSQFHDYSLTDAQRRALVFLREVGAITNQDYRQINGVDTLNASRALSQLRDSQLIKMKGGGNRTYYVPVKQKDMPELEKANFEIVSANPGMSEAPSSRPNPVDKGGTPYTNPLYTGLTPYVNPVHKELTPYVNPVHKGLPALPTDLKRVVENLPKRCSQDVLKEIIKRLCELQPLQIAQLSSILGRHTQYLRINFLSKMIKTGELAYLHPERPAHPHQAYLVPKNGNGDAVPSKSNGSY